MLPGFLQYTIVNIAENTPKFLISELKLAIFTLYKAQPLCYHPDFDTPTPEKPSKYKAKTEVLAI
jgi:hypothetical protein